MNGLVEFCDTYGLHPLVGFGLFAVDWMLFAAEGVTLGASWLISAPAGVVLAVGSVLIQKYGYKDGWGFALGKGVIVGLLTAIPAPLPSVVPLVGGAMGTVAVRSRNRALIEGSPDWSSGASNNGVKSDGARRTF